MNLYALVRDVKDFPKEGILFKDITTLLQDGEGLSESIDQIAAHLENVEFDSVVGREARGFIFGVPTAYKLKKALFLLESQVNYLINVFHKLMI